MCRVHRIAARIPLRTRPELAPIREIGGRVPHQPVLPAGPPGALVMDGTLLPGVWVDIGWAVRPGVLLFSFSCSRHPCCA